jgi:hypothetical protein
METTTSAFHVTEPARAAFTGSDLVIQHLRNGKTRSFPEIYHQMQKSLICFMQVVMFLQRSLQAALKGGELSLQMIRKRDYKVVSSVQNVQRGRTNVIGVATSAMMVIGASVISVSIKADLAHIPSCL